MPVLRVLVDLLDKAEEVWLQRRVEYQLKGVGSPSTLVGSPSTLVHCSAGVSRTGVFLGLYRLWLAYRGEAFLDIPATVAAMREQRARMVERPELYTYLVKCLRCNQLQLVLIFNFCSAFL